MKFLVIRTILIAGLFSMQACTKTESNFTAPRQETITIGASTLNATKGSVVTFSVLSSVNNANVTADSKIYINGTLITGSSFTFTDAGTFAVYATKGTLNSNVITVAVTAPVPNARYKHNVLVEEYSGTWCGNCPRILYGVELLEQQTDKVIVVSTHLFNDDPFITSEGNNLAAQQGVGGVPTGYINRTISWKGPEYENVPQVINTIQASAPAGVAITSAVSNNTLSVTIKAGFSEPLSGGAKLTVYLVEDSLLYTQRNYSSNLYNGLGSIPNFKYNGVLRKVVSALSGDVISASGEMNEKTYSLSVPAIITDIKNTRVVAFITNASGTVVNVQEVKVGEAKNFDVL